MTETTAKRKGGRPPLPQPPQNAAECRALIAQETVRTTPRDRTLRYLYRLLKSFVAAEEISQADAKTKAIDEANRLKQSEIELRRADYQLRFSKGPLAVKTIQRQMQRIAELETRVAELEAEKKVNSGPVPTLTEIEVYAA